MSEEYRKFELSPGQQSPEGSTGDCTQDGYIIWVGESGTFPILEEDSAGEIDSIGEVDSVGIKSWLMTQKEIDDYLWRLNMEPLYINVKKFIETKPNGAIRYDSDLKMNLMMTMMNAISSGVDVPQICLDVKNWIMAVQTEFFTLKALIKGGGTPDISYEMFENKYGENGSVLADPQISTTDLAATGLL